MALMRGQLANTVVKTGICGHNTGNTTNTAYPIDLDSVLTGQRPTWCKIIFSGMKTGTTALCNVAVTPLTGTTVSCATGMSHYPISVPVANTTHSGAVIIGGTVETGRFDQVYDIDLQDSQVRTWIGATATVTVTSTDVVDFALIFVFGGFRELPATNTAQATMA